MKTQGMDPQKVEEYLSEVPFEIRNAIKPLNNDKIWAILIALLKNEEMRFGEIKSALGTQSSGEIDRYLKQLTAAGLVEREARKVEELGDKERSYYCPTNLSRSLMSALFVSILPHPRVYRRDRMSVKREFVEYGGKDRASTIRYEKPEPGMKYGYVQRGVRI